MTGICPLLGSQNELAAKSLGDRTPRFEEGFKMHFGSLLKS